MRSRWRLAAFGCVLLLVAGACGQKPGVSDELIAGAGGTFIDPATGQVVDAQGNPIGTTTTGLDTGTGSVAGGGGTTTTTGGGTGTDTETGGGGGTTTAPSGGNTTGVTDSLVKVGSHAPLTGAAPVPSDSAEKGKDLYFRWLKEHEKTNVEGRDVEVVLKNDNYNPSQAVAVCKEMVEKDKVFLLSGAAGTDQIVACAKYAASVNVPYISAGVTRIGLEGLPGYFATSMTYPEQGPLLADFLVSDLGAKSEKNGMVRFDTTNFQDAHDEFAGAMEDKGAPLDYDRAVSKTSNAQVADQVVTEMKLDGIENVYVLTSPLFAIQLWKSADRQQYTPQWVGIGITMTFDTVAAAGCPNIDKSKFFAPFPAWIDSNKFDQEFQQAVREFYSEECGSAGCGDDFMWLAWSGSKTLAEFLSVTGRELTRERFVYAVERARGVKNEVGPTLNYTPEDHFGASEVHVLEASCSDRRWHTKQSFVSDF